MTVTTSTAEGLAHGRDAIPEVDRGVLSWPIAGAAAG